jgi:WD40 repeat protein
LQIRRLAGGTLEIPTQYRGGIVLLSPDNAWLAHFSSGVLEMFSTDTGRLLWSRAQETSASVFCAFSHAGRLLAASSTPGAMIRLIDCATGEEVATITPQVNLQVTGLAFSADDQTLAVNHGRMILLWDLRSLRLQLRTLGLDWRDENPSGSFAP